MIGRVFPGSRAVWLGALAGLALLAVVFVRDLGARTLALTGTNSVDVAAVVRVAKDGERFCVRELRIPPRTAMVQVWFGAPRFTGRRPLVVRGSLVDGARRWRLERTVTGSAGGWQPFALGQPQRLAAPRPGRLCLTPRGGRLDLGGSSVQRIPGQPVSDLDGEPLTGVDIGVRYVGTPGSSRVISRLPEGLSRAAIFTLAPGQTWVLWLLMLALVASAYLAVRTAATLGPDSGARALAWRAFAIALVAAAAWALMMPPFHGADESEHYAYAEHVAATNQVPESARGTRKPYSTEQERLLGAVHHNSTIVDGGSRPRWQAYWRDLETRRDRGVSNRDGGGYTDSATGHGPLYYGAVGIPYRVLHGHADQAQVLTAMRLFNAAAAALVPALAVLIAALLLPGRPAVWWLAGLLVACQPVYASVSATINNDTAVNVLAALGLYAVVALYVRGPTTRNAILLGICVALLPVVKITGFAMLPVLALGGLAVAVRHRSLPALRTLALAPASCAAAIAAWVFVVAPLIGGERGALINTHPGEGLSSGEAAVRVAAPGWLDKIDYALQMVAPWVHLTGDLWRQDYPLYSLYVERGYGRFGWLNAAISDGGLAVIVLLLVVGWGLALAAAWQRRRTLLAWGPMAALLALSVLGVVMFVALAYVSPGGREVIGEQGRYIFPAIVALAVLLAAGVEALRGRARDAYLGFMCSAVALVGLLGWSSALRDWFT